MSTLVCRPRLQVRLVVVVVRCETYGYQAGYSRFAYYRHWNGGLDGYTTTQLTYRLHEDIDPRCISPVMSAASQRLQA